MEDNPRYTPIETRYAGCHFRSRLEARWAVFFDQLNIQWEYEPEGMNIRTPGGEEGKSWRYLPDFWLPGLESYAEVKGTDDAITDEYREMLAWVIDYRTTPLHKGLLLLGPIPDTTGVTFIFHHQLYWHEGISISNLRFVPLWQRAGAELAAADLGVGLRGDHDGATAPDFPRSASWNATRLIVENADDGTYWPMDTTIAAAYVAARSKRFEYGE